MAKWYVYVSEYGNRIYANIYEADSKNEVKNLLLSDLEDWLPEVKLRSSKNGLNQYITAIHEINDYWEGIFLEPRKCVNCLNFFTKIDKLKLQTGGTAQFCSSECEVEYREKLDPNATTTWNNGTVYKITHTPTGKFYVGVTTRWVMQRWWEHIKAESGSPFHNFLKDSNITDFSFSILESFKPTEVNPYEREAYWITALDAINLGLNTASSHKVLDK